MDAIYDIPEGKNAKQYGKCFASLVMRHVLQATDSKSNCLHYRVWYFG